MNWCLKLLKIINALEFRKARGEAEAPEDSVIETYLLAAEMKALTIVVNNGNLTKAYEDYATAAEEVLNGIIEGTSLESRSRAKNLTEAACHMIEVIYKLIE